MRDGRLAGSSTGQVGDSRDCQPHPKIFAYSRPMYADTDRRGHGQLQGRGLVPDICAICLCKMRPTQAKWAQANQNEVINACWTFCRMLNWAQSIRINCRWIWMRASYRICCCRNLSSQSARITCCPGRRRKVDERRRQPPHPAFIFCSRRRHRRHSSRQLRRNHFSRSKVSRQMSARTRQLLPLTATFHLHAIPEPLELQIEYWPINRPTIERDKSQTKAADQGKCSIKGTFKSLQVCGCLPIRARRSRYQLCIRMLICIVAMWQVCRLPMSQQLCDISQGLTCLYATKEKKQKSTYLLQMVL